MLVRVYPASNGLSDHDEQILIPGNLQSLSQHIIYKSNVYSTMHHCNS